MVAAKTKLIRIRLLQDHERAGRQIEAGDFLDIPPGKLAWFTSQGIAEPLDPNPVTPSKLPSKERNNG